MRRLMTGVLVAALLVSQTSIANVFLKTDAATALAAEEEEQFGDEVEAVTEDADTSDSQTEVDDVEEVAPDENPEPEEEEIPEDPEVIPGTEEEEPDELDTEEEDLLTEADIALLDVEDVPVAILEEEDQLGTQLDAEGTVFDEVSGIKVWYKEGTDGDGVLTIIVDNDKFNGAFRDFSPRDPESAHPQSSGLMTMDLEDAAAAPDVPWKGCLTGIGEVRFVGKNDQSETAGDVEPKVTHIGAYMFNGCDNLTKITIPSGVTSIGNGAFMGCSSLPSITIPGGVTTIGDSAFRDCVGFTSITIPTNVTYIGANAFDGCNSVASISMPAIVNTIGDEAFGAVNRGNLVSNVTPTEIAVLEGIGSDALSTLTGLKTVMYPSSVTPANGHAFSNATAQIKYVSGNGGIDITEIIPASDAGARSVSIHDKMCGMTVLSVADVNSRQFVILHDGSNNQHTNKPDEGVVKKEATCKEAGEKITTCLICGDEKSEIIDALAHTFTSKWYHDDAKHWKICSVCGAESEHAEHTVPGTSCDVCDKYAQSEKDPNQPGGEDPNQPGGEDPNQPGGEDPNQPGGEDPNQPGDTPVTPQPPTPQPPATGGNDGGGSGSGSSSSGSSSTGTSANSGSATTANNQGSTNAAADTTTVVTYTVESGDTLSKIALKYYGSSSYWTKIFADNADTIKDPNKIYVGQILKIYLTQNNGAAATPGAPVAGTNYTVVSGDSLSKIAQKVYGQSGQWRKIYDANAGTIQDPSRIYVGQVIVIPE